MIMMMMMMLLMFVQQLVVCLGAVHTFGPELSIFIFDTRNFTSHTPAKIVEVGNCTPIGLLCCGI